MNLGLIRWECDRTEFHEGTGNVLMLHSLLSPDDDLPIKGVEAFLKETMGAEEGALPPSPQLLRARAASKGQ